MNSFFFYEANLPKILFNQKITLAFTTYQAGKIIFLSSTNGETLVKYAKNFKRPMGIAYDPINQRLAVASKTSIDLFSNSSPLARHFPEYPNKHDHLFIHQSRYQTGFLDTHEIEFGNDQLWVVNTMFSCISSVSPFYHFKTYWKPSFITDLMPEDRCHLNGLELENGEPAFVTCFDGTNAPFGWKNKTLRTGKLIDIRSNKTLLDELPMPHSPVLVNDRIYFLLSGTGEVMEYSLKTGETRCIIKLSSFLRGLAAFGNFLFVGCSKIRDDSTVFSELEISSKSSFCGIYVIDLRTGINVAGITYTDIVKEIFSIKVIPNSISPGLLTERDEYHDKCILAEENLNFWINSRGNPNSP
ncbi:MAG: TIGR03032 family protein [Imperialibacter sp.]|uniref:TIGR03032 family protein n=1 Tax=Imperialibacter sp. TaxID=2038411 RepID=UPI0032F074B4